LTRVEEISAFRLPKPDLAGTVSVEDAMRRRVSTREFASRTLSQGDLSRLLWAGQGLKDSEGRRTCPSAGALYPLELHVAAGEVEGMAAGVYRYRPWKHDLVLEAAGDRREALGAASLHQEWVEECAAVIVVAAVFERVTGSYGPRGERYIHMEAGHAAQSIHLMAAARGLGTVVVGAFDDGKVAAALDLPERERSLLLMPVGWPRP
jgi:SagB-type dehydrogenase family enzyme